MKPARIAILGAWVALAGCAHYNAVYNGERAYREAEQLRRAGLDSLAVSGYHDVIRRASAAYRGRPEADRAARTLFLLGRARLRLGELRPARLALEEAAALAGSGELHREVLVYLGIAHARVGERGAALATVSRALDGPLAYGALAEALVLRGSLLISEGRVDEGWSDLDAAAAADEGIATEATLEQLRWSVEQRRAERVPSALRAVLAVPAAGDRLEAIRTLVGEAEATWGAAWTAAALASAGTPLWQQPARGRMELELAQLFRMAGDTVAASEQAWRVARGRGVAAAEARLALAAWHLGATRDLGEAHAIIPVLLPSGEDERVAALIDALDALDRYSGMGLDDPLSWFVAAELARDRLEAPILARGLFMAYADTDPSDPWAAKALLAALDASPDEDDRTWLRGRLEAHRHSPYVLAAYGGAADGFEALEEELLVRLREIRGG